MGLRERFKILQLKLLRLYRWCFPRAHAKAVRIFAYCACVCVATAALTSKLPHWLPAVYGTNIAGLVLLSAVPPSQVPGDGIRALQSIDIELTQCSNKKSLTNAHSSSASLALDLALSDASVEDEFALPVNAAAGVKRSHRRKAFVCAAGCSARELQLETSLAPWADWPANFSGMTMLRTLQGFCEGQKERESKDPFVVVALWRGDVYFKACGAPNISYPGLYLIGPEDLSMVGVFLIGAQRVAPLPRGPIAFGMYLSDYTSLVDHHLIGPGLPMFAYLSRTTSWAIPFPSSFTVYSTQEIEELSREANLQAKERPRVAQKPWHLRHSKAYWIGTVTGPWEFQMDAGLEAVPRLKFLRLAKEHPQQLHAEWSSLAGYGIAWIEDDSTIAGLLAPRSRSVENFTGIARSGFKAVDQWTHYKYYLNLDGVVLGGRLNKLMALGGVILQHQAGYIEHFDALVKPYEHYVPVAYDLSDLLSKVEWLQKNDAEAQRIAKRAKALAAERMRLEDHICYVWRALEALGVKTASADVDAAAVDKHLSDEGFKRLTLKKGGMRPTLEAFWGKKLEDVWTGKRRMHSRGISMLKWVWDRFEKLNAQAQRA